MERGRAETKLGTLHASAPQIRFYPDLSRKHQARPPPKTADAGLGRYEGRLATAGTANVTVSPARCITPQTMAAAEKDKKKRDWLRERVVRSLRSFGRIWSTPERLPTTLAIVIGAVTGLSAWLFSKLVTWVETLYFEEAGGALRPPWA